VLAPQRKDTGGVGEVPRGVLPQEPAEEVAPILVARQGDLRDPQLGETRRVQILLHEPVPDHELILGGPVPLPHAGPLGEQTTGFGMQRGFQGVIPGLQVGERGRRRNGRHLGADHIPLLLDLRGLPAGVPPEQIDRAVHLPELARDLALAVDESLKIVDCLGDLGQVTDPGRWDDGLLAGGLSGIRRRGKHQRGALLQQPHHERAQLGGAGIIELRRDGSDDRHLLERSLEAGPVPLHLFAHVPQRIECAGLVELVHRHGIGKIEHVDLFELRGRSVVRGHDIEGDVRMLHDLGVRLTDPRGLHDHEVKPRGPTDVRGFPHMTTEGQVRLPRGERPHVHPGVLNCVHPDPVAEEGPAGASARGVDGDDGDRVIRSSDEIAPDELIHEARLAGAPGSGDAEHRDGGRGETGGELLPKAAGGLGVILGHGDELGNAIGLVGRERGDGTVPVARPGGKVALREEVVDHPLEAEASAVVRGVDAGDSRGMEGLHLFGENGASSSSEDLDVGPAVPKELDKIAEILDVPALVTRDGNSLDVLLDGAVHDVGHGAVVAEVDHLRSGGLKDASHDIDGGVVPVEQGRRGDEPDGMGGLIDGLCFHVRNIVPGRRTGDRGPTWNP